jgi:hypothetical protein
LFPTLPLRLKEVAFLSKVEFPIGTRGSGISQGLWKQESLSSPPSQGEFPIGARGVGSFKGVVGKGIDFLSSNPKMNFLEEEGAWDPSQPGCGKGDHYIRKCSSLHLTKGKKKVMFIS